MSDTDPVIQRPSLKLLIFLVSNTLLFFPGCDLNHEKIDPEALNKSFMLRVRDNFL